MNRQGATHFTWNDRLTLERMIKEGFKKPEIAKALGNVNAPFTMKSTGGYANS